MEFTEEVKQRKARKEPLIIRESWLERAYNQKVSLVSIQILVLLLSRAFRSKLCLYEKVTVVLYRKPP